MNKMAEVAKLFDKELEEKFTIIDDNDEVVIDACFNEAGIAFWNPNNDKPLTSQSILNKLLNGTYRIKKTPWKPKYGEIYFAPRIDSCEKYAKFFQTCDKLDDRTYRQGLMCKTQEQAEEIAEAMIKVARKMQGFDDEEE